jgi:hypothetical protein
VETTLSAKRVTHAPIPFVLTVDLDADLTAVSNLERHSVQTLTGEYKRRYMFSAAQGRDVFLMAGPYHYEKRPFPGLQAYVEVCCFPRHQNRIDHFLQAGAPQYLFYEDMLQPGHAANTDSNQSGKICTIVETPQFFAPFYDGQHVSVALTDTVLIIEDVFGLDEMFLEDAKMGLGEIGLLQRWWQDLVEVCGCRQGNITEGLVLYLHILYAEKIYGHGYYEQAKQNLQNEDGRLWRNVTVFEGPVVRDVFMTLDCIRTSALGDPAIKQIMRDLYQRYTSKGRIDPEDFAAAVKVLLLEADWPEENTVEVLQRLDRIVQHVDEAKVIRSRVNPVLSFDTFPFSSEAPLAFILRTLDVEF